jgi:hypothetical protein
VGCVLLLTWVLAGEPASGLRGAGARAGGHVGCGSVGDRWAMGVGGRNEPTMSRRGTISGSEPHVKNHVI